MIKDFKTVSMLCSMGLVTIGTATASSFNDVAETEVVQQNNTCNGNVKDDTGETIIGASVVVKGTTNGTITDFDGNFSLSNLNKGDVIEVSYIGYKTLTVTWNGSPLNLVLKSDTQTLDEVVVVGFGTQKKVNLTGSVSTVGAEELASRPVSNVSQALQGLVPGMNFDYGTKGNGGALNTEMNINIRGTGTIGEGSNAAPLILIDGMEGNMNMLNPNDIENICLLYTSDAADE